MQEEVGNKAMKCKYCKEGFAIDLEIEACMDCHIKVFGYTKKDEIADAMLDVKNNDFFVSNRKVVKGSDEWFQLYQWGYEIPSSDIKLFKTEYAKQKGGN